METREVVLLMNEDGTPKLAELHMRQSETGPNRLKVTFGVDASGGLIARAPTGEQKKMVDLPEDVGQIALCEEFRLEMS